MRALTFDWLKSGLSSWQQMWANILAHHFSSVGPKCVRERGVITEYVSSMGHPGKLLSSQVVAIQWYLLQGHMLAFIKRYQQLYLPRSSERVCTCGAQPLNLRMDLHPGRDCLEVVGFLVVMHTGYGLLRWKHAQSSQLGKDSDIIWQMSSLPLAHAC